MSIANCNSELSNEGEAGRPGPPARSKATPPSAGSFAATGHMSPWQPGQSGNPAGKKPGTPNKYKRNVMAVVEDALDMVGGAAYIARFAESYPVQFMQIVAKLLPKQIVSSSVSARVTTADMLAQMREQAGLKPTNEVAQEAREVQVEEVKDGEALS